VADRSARFGNQAGDQLLRIRKPVGRSAADRQIEALGELDHLARLLERHAQRLSRNRHACPHSSAAQLSAKWLSGVVRLTMIEHSRRQAFLERAIGPDIVEIGKLLRQAAAHHDPRPRQG
jgi:hypothetical protein